MGGAPNYRKGRAAMRRMTEGKARAFAQNIIVESGKGKYPKCLKDDPKLYEWCPKEEVKDHKNVPKECKNCPQYTRSKFWEETTAADRMKRIQELAAEMSKR